jgi:hypothetical protein
MGVGGRGFRVANTTPRGAPRQLRGQQSFHWSINSCSLLEHGFNYRVHSTHPIFLNQTHSVHTHKSRSFKGHYTLFSYLRTYFRSTCLVLIFLLQLCIHFHSPIYTCYTPNQSYHFYSILFPCTSVGSITEKQTNKAHCIYIYIYIYIYIPYSRRNMLD